VSCLFLGLFGAIMCVPEESTHRLPEVISCFQKNLLHLCTGVTDEEVERVKTLLKAQMLNQLDSHSLVLEDIGRQVMSKDIYVWWDFFTSLTDANLQSSHERRRSFRSD
jgi:predicted Zn-dependent peptidase